MKVASLAWMAGGDVLYPGPRPREPAARGRLDRPPVHPGRRLPGLLRQPPRAPGGPAPCLVSSGGCCVTPPRPRALRGMNPAACAARCSSASSRSAPASPAAAAPPDAATILRRADRAVLGEAAAYTLRMTVVRPEKPERVVEMKGWKKGDEQGLVRYTAPAKERGTAYLRSGESTWLFLPVGREGRPRGGQAELRRRRLLERRHLPPLARQGLRPDARGRGDGRGRGLLQARAQGEGPLRSPTTGSSTGCAATAPSTR